MVYLPHLQSQKTVILSCLFHLPSLATPFLGSFCPAHCPSIQLLQTAGLLPLGKSASSHTLPHSPFQQAQSLTKTKSDALAADDG